MYKNEPGYIESQVEEAEYVLRFGKEEVEKTPEDLKDESAEVMGLYFDDAVKIILE